MSIQKYAFKSKGKFIRNWSDSSAELDSFTDDLDKAKLYAAPTINLHVEVFAQRGYEMVEVEIGRTVVGPARAMTDVLQERLDILQQEYDQLDVFAQKDIDAMPEADFRRYKRLGTVIKNRAPSMLTW
jgi:hypothetical protein